MQHPFEAESRVNLIPVPDAFSAAMASKYGLPGGGSAFSDLCYDGYRIDPGSLLDGGLGCLTDNRIAPQTATPTPTSASSSSSSKHNSLFVGWHRSRWKVPGSVNTDDVVNMLFQFVTVRRFERLKIYASNNFEAHVSVQ